MSYTKKVLSIDEYRRQSAEYDKVKYTCECGHRVVIPHWRDKGLCSWCHNYVYKDKQMYFRERLKQEMRKEV